MGDNSKRSNFFIDETKKVVLFCLCIETRSNIHYFWNFTLHSISSSNCVLRPCCSSTPFYPERPRCSVHLSDSSKRDFLKRSNFFTDGTKKVVVTCLRLETASNIYYFWKFTMQSISSSNCVLVPWCSSTPFYPKRARYSVRLSDSSKGDKLKNRQFFHRWDQKRGFNLSTLRNTFQNSLLLKFHHALNFFIKFLLLPWCTSTPIYSKRARYSVHLKNSSMEDILKRSNFFTDETKKVVLTCLRLETRSDNYHYWNSTMHSIDSSNFFLRPWCTSPIFSKRARYLFISLVHPWGIFWKEALFS